MDQQTFGITVRARYPQLFETVQPLVVNTLKDLTDDLVKDESWELGEKETQTLLARFLAKYQKTESYVLMLCRHYLEKKPRIGLNENKPILKGEIMELVTFYNANDKSKLKKHNLFRYFEGCEEAVGYVTNL
ncbi:hypothetical protein [Candidatus Enterovibrio escicola]|uniref:hypothetical protein n=1 Tax=Candidatus Enterovibrio escicola TaxID=1927127 RepID=UPI001237BF4C|nr:hypothetical protein [Candidatus Enterovibrio escacola]